MQNRVDIVAAAVILGAGASGCAEQSTAERKETGRVTVDGTTHTTRTVECGQVGWLLIIKTTAGPGQARAFLQLGGEQPAVKTVNLASFDGFNGVAGEGVGSIEASAAEGTYTITGTAEGSDLENPGGTRTAPFRIEAPC